MSVDNPAGVYMGPEFHPGVINVNLRLLDFMEGTPVSNADVTVIAKVLARWQLTSPGRPPVRVTVADLTRAEVLTKSDKSLGDGTIQCSFDVSAAFTKQRQAPGPGGTLLDVIAVLSIQVARAGLEHTLNLYDEHELETAVITEVSEEDLLQENVNVAKVILVDFAKIIVGHTTPTSVVLWFCLHGIVRDGDIYVCEVEQVTSASTATTPLRTLPVSFDPLRANTAVLTLSDLQPATQYQFALRLQRKTQDKPNPFLIPAGAAPQVPEQNAPILDEIFVPMTSALAKGKFTTAPADFDSMSFVFGSCHQPSGTEESLERWKELAGRQDYDFMLLIGDQIYADQIEDRWRSLEWPARYINRYNQLWTYWPMRQVLRRTPTYMVLDDHEIKDDWGTVPLDPPERLEPGIAAYRMFQQSHNPGGYEGPIHYSFRWGPASFFVMDSRSARSVDPEKAEYPVLGPNQYAALQRWATCEETRTADIIFRCTGTDRFYPSRGS